MAIRRQIGLKDFIVAPVETDVSGGETTHGEVVKIPGIISANITIERGADKLYSDDTTEDVIDYLSSITVEVEVANLSIKEREVLLGQKVVKGAAAGNIDDVANEVGIAFRSKKTNGKYRYVSIPKGKFSEPSESYSTATDGVTAQTITMTFTGMPLASNGNYKITVDEDSEDVDSTYVEKFLEKIQTKLPDVTSEL